MTSTSRCLTLVTWGAIQSHPENCPEKCPEICPEKYPENPSKSYNKKFKKWLLVHISKTRTIFGTIFGT